MLLCKKPRIFNIDLIGPALMVGLFGLTYFAVIKPLHSMAAECQTEQQDMLAKKNYTEKELERLQHLNRRQQLLAEQLSRTADVLAKNGGMAHTLRQLGVLAQSNGLRLEELTPGEMAVDEHYSWTPLTLRLTGGFPPLQAFLNRLADQMPYLRIASLEAATTRVGETNACDVALELHVFAAL